MSDVQRAPRANRVMINFRIALDKRDWLDELAHEHWTDRAAVIRAGLGVAKRHETELIEVLRRAAEAG